MNTGAVPPVGGQVPSVPPPMGVPVGEGASGNVSVGTGTPGLVLSAAAPRTGESWAVKDLMLVQMYVVLLGLLFW